MFLILLCFPVALWAAKDIFPIGCQQPGKSTSSSPLCQTSLHGLHLICAPFPWSQAALACSDLGLRLASITDDNVLYAQELLKSCLFTGRAWIAAYGGLNAEPVMMFGAESVVVRGDSNGYRWELAQPMCQDIPVVTVSTSLTTTTTISTGTVTVRVTETVTKPSRPHRSHHHHRHEKDDTKNEKSCCPILAPNNRTCSCCSDSCSTTVDGLHIVTGVMMNSDDAKKACHRHGWHLADYLSGMTSIIKDNLISQCGLSDRQQGLWVRSFEGIANADCVRVLIEPFSFIAEFGLTDNFCNGQNVISNNMAALCQEQCPLITGLGPYHGRFNTTTTSIVSTEYIKVPLTTETITRTVHCHH